MSIHGFFFFVIKTYRFEMQLFLNRKPIKSKTVKQTKCSKLKDKMIFILQLTFKIQVHFPFLYVFV